MAAARLTLLRASRSWSSALAATAAFRRGPSSRFIGPIALDARSRPAATPSSRPAPPGAPVIPSANNPPSRFRPATHTPPLSPTPPKHPPFLPPPLPPPPPHPPPRPH